MKEIEKKTEIRLQQNMKKIGSAPCNNKRKEERNKEKQKNKNKNKAEYDKSQDKI